MPLHNDGSKEHISLTSYGVHTRDTVADGNEQNSLMRFSTSPFSTPGA